MRFVDTYTLTAASGGDNAISINQPLPDKEQAKERHGKRKPTMYERLRYSENIFVAAKKAILNFPFKTWTCFIQACLIPSFRPEWGRKFSKWDHTMKKKRTDDMRKRNSYIPKTVRKRQNQLLKSLADAPPVPVEHDHTECLIVKINVSGLLFEPQVRTLNQFPGTLLSDPKRMAQYYDPERDEFFFDRHRSSFQGIIYFYQSGGIVRQPYGVEFAVFLDEVKFFDLGPKVVKALENAEGIGIEEEKFLPKGLFKRKLWLLFEYPESSYQARIVAYLSILVVCVSLFSFCIDTMPAFTIEGVEDLFDLQDPFYMCESLCIMFFCFEYAMRLFTCPDRYIFLKEFANIIDLAAILPYFANIVLNIPDANGTSEGISNNTTASFTILRIIRLVRVFRILKLSRHNRGLKVLGKTLRASIRELGLLVFFLFIGIIVFSSAMFYAEYNTEDSQFDSIPAGFWFSVVTMTTLGYGDMVPKSTWGKIVGSLCAFCGVLTISLPVPVIVSNFNTFYNRDEMTKDHLQPDYEHVDQCPYYPGWYSSDGQVVNEKSGFRTENSGGPCATWLIGDQKMDKSDSEFEELKIPEVDDTIIRKEKTGKKHKGKHARFSKSTRKMGYK